MGSEIKIKAVYDSAFPFNKNNNLALVFVENKFKTTLNHLTGEEEKQFDYLFINSSNHKLSIKPDNFPDSISVFENQYELQNEYLDSNNVFKLLFQNKVYLMSKKGKQLSGGFDNITETKNKLFYFSENNSEIDKTILTSIGLIDTLGRTIIKCKYKHIEFNNEDSSIYCCSAVFSNKQNDDVYDYNGKIVYTDRKHISFSSKQIHIMKLYEPKPCFLVENSEKNTSKIIGGTEFHYIGNNIGLLIDDENWYIINIKTFEKKKINKEKFNNSLLTIFGI